MTTTFTVITPCFNAELWIEGTMQSVLAQSCFRDGSARLQYIVADGASRDSTVEIVRGIIQDHSDDHLTIKLISEPDDGVYDALAKGLARAEGDICCYINAGDFHHPQSFGVVAAIFEAGLARWLTGFQSVCNTAGELTDVRIPYRYRRAFFANGFYGSRLPVVQQESTFWSADLNALVDLERLRSFRLAGDFYLWHCFAGAEDLRIVASMLGCFRKMPGQLSDKYRDVYSNELRLISREPTLAEKMLGHHDAVKFRWLRTGRRRDASHIIFDHKGGRWS